MSKASEHNDAYSEQYRKHTVNTKMSTLLAMRPLFKEIGLDSLLKSGEADTKALVSGVINALAEKNIINEFCQLATGERQVDFNEVNFGEVAWVINDFFVEYWWQMPPSWRESIKKVTGILQEMGKMLLPAVPKQPEPQPGSETPATGSEKQE